MRVPSIRPIVEESVTISGHVYRPGRFEYRPGMRIADLIPTLDELKPNADIHYVLIRRERGDSRRIDVVSADFADALMAEQEADAAEDIAQTAALLSGDPQQLMEWARRADVAAARLIEAARAARTEAGART